MNKNPSLCSGTLISDENKVLVILGPTATGKTDLALSLAKKYNGELVACDSRQVYKGLDIGTGKEPSNSHPELVSGSFKEMPKLVRHDVKKRNGYWEIDGMSKAPAGAIKIWMYDVVDLKMQFNVKDFVDQASKIVEDIFRRRKLPVIVGGTGLYLKALLQGLPNLAVPTDTKLRRELESLSLEELQNKLASLSPIKWEKLNNSDKQNKRHLLRPIEIAIMNPYDNTYQNSKLKTQNWNLLKIGLTAPRQVLYEKINSRVFDWINKGILEEVKRLLQIGINEERFYQLGLEYAVIIDYLQGKTGKKEMIYKMQSKVRQYAKRQLTWFKKEEGVIWFDVTTKNWQDQVEKKVSSWYHAGDD